MTSSAILHSEEGITKALIRCVGRSAPLLLPCNKIRLFCMEAHFKKKNTRFLLFIPWQFYSRSALSPLVAGIFDFFSVFVSIILHNSVVL